MILNKLTKGLVLALGLSLSIAAVQAQDYLKTNSGLRLKIIRSNNSTVKPKAGDMVILKMVYRNSKDSVLLDSRKNSEPFSYNITEPAYPGDFNEAMMLGGKGDSLSFILDAESFYLKTLKVKTLPSFIKRGSNLTFFVKVLNIKTEQEVLKEQIAYMKAANEKNEKRKKEESDTLNKYLTDNKISIKPTSSGLYFIPDREGNGAKPVKGNTLIVNYKGYFLDGKVFDSSYDSGAPFEFKMGAGQVIKGWEEGLSMMKKGGKAKLIIPSSLAYGENQAGEIEPFTTLIFEIELIDIK